VVVYIKVKLWYSSVFSIIQKINGVDKMSEFKNKVVAITSENEEQFSKDITSYVNDYYRIINSGCNTIQNEKGETINTWWAILASSLGM
jgi:hypothetical protein